MRVALAIFIYLVTACQPSKAIIGVAADDVEVKPVLNEKSHEQPGSTEPGSGAKVLPEASRGQLLYENHCTGCHESMVYIRARRKAKNFKQVGNWVNQRADWLNLNWSTLEKREVQQYLNKRYYKYPLYE